MTFVSHSAKGALRIDAQHEDAKQPNAFEMAVFNRQS